MGNQVSDQQIINEWVVNHSNHVIIIKLTNNKSAIEQKSRETINPKQQQLGVEQAIDTLQSMTC